jgi:cytochrome oxidase Cu insertion factor (SCO1/SenC/PrrC family)
VIQAPESTEHDAPEPQRAHGVVQGAPKMPVRYIYALVAVALVLLVGLTVADRVLSSSTTSSTAPVSPSPASPNWRVAPAGQPTLHAPLDAFLGLRSLGGHKAPAWTLVDAASGAHVSLRSLRGHVVVLTFANAACNDICPVLTDEIAQADAMLGATRLPVTFVTVNSDPLDLRTGTGAAILTQPSVAHLANWRFLTGPITTLNPLWMAYGISISAYRSSGTATHNDLMYFIGPSGNLVWSATPWADQTAHGYTLPASDTQRFAKGIATYADKLARQA